jgi:hypothetical protein
MLRVRNCLSAVLAQQSHPTAAEGNDLLYWLHNKSHFTTINILVMLCWLQQEGHTSLATGRRAASIGMQALLIQ